MFLAIYNILVNIVNKNIKLRIINEVEYMLKKECTIRELAKIFLVSKSTVHKDLNDRLLYINEEKYYEVKKIFDKHIKERHINGGQATKKKYKAMKGGNNERYRNRFRYS